MPSRPRVVIAYKSLPRYRVPFYEALRARLDEAGVDLGLVYGQAPPREAHRNEDADIGWALRRRNRVLKLGRREVVWQPCLSDVRGADLVIVEQASRVLINYVLLARQAAGLSRVAFWGHGANLQPQTASAASEWLKRKVSRLPHWWFAYTEGSRRRVEALGYPSERITVVQNAQDTEELAAAIDRITDEDRAAYRARHGLGDGPVGLFLGSLAREKRIDVLLDAADTIVARRPDFRLLVAGDGEERRRVEAAARQRPWIRALGRVDDLPSRALALSVSSSLLVPGAVGLAAVDSFAAGVPLVAIAGAGHGPEIEYVDDGANGVLVPESVGARGYADGALETMTRGTLRSRLLDGCRAARGVFTLDAMVTRFASGISTALAA
jgi:glycosyltransferase involved in cell wall biosynthesis